MEIISRDFERIDQSENKKVLILSTILDLDSVEFNDLISLLKYKVELTFKQDKCCYSLPIELATSIPNSLTEYSKIYATTSIFIDSGLCNIYKYIKNNKEVEIINTFKLEGVTFDKVVENSAYHIKSVYEKRIKDFYFNNFFPNFIPEPVLQSTVYSKCDIIGELSADVPNAIVSRLREDRQLVCFYTRGTINPLSGNYNLEIFSDFEVEEMMGDSRVKLTIFSLGEYTIGDKFYSEIRVPNKLKGSYTERDIGYFFVMNSPKPIKITKDNYIEVYEDSIKDRQSTSYIVGSKILSSSYPMRLEKHLNDGETKIANVAKGIEVLINPFYLDSININIGGKNLWTLEESLVELYSNKEGNEVMEILYKGFAFNLKVEESRFIKSILKHLDGLLS